MQAIRSVHTVTGPTLTVAVPADFAGKQVEVIVQPVADLEKTLPPEHDPRYAPYIMAKPSLTEEQKKEFEQNRYPLRGTVLEYVDPYEPAVPPEDWDVYREEGDGAQDDPS